MAGGVDGLELHAHESFLRAQFLSPRWNVRTDQYGGSLENRARLLVETLQTMRAAIGPRTVLGVRLKADDVAPGGMTLGDYLELVAFIDRLRIVDYLSFTAGDLALHHGPMYRPDGECLPLVGRIRQTTRLPILHAGRITDPFLAERAVASGQIDVVGMTKAHIADPHFTRKVALGQLDDVRYCTRCLQSCIGKVEHLTCVYNPVTGRESEWAELRPAAQRRRVIVVGAGPAGLEAALVAARRGHEVIVVEASGQIGGQVRLAAGSPLRAKFGEIVSFYERQVAKGQIDLRLTVAADATLVRDLHPDAVVIATGSTPRRARLPSAAPGETRETLTIHEALAQGEENGKGRRAVVVDREGQMRAFVVADLLSERGFTVEFLTPFAQPGPQIDSLNLGELCERLGARGVRVRPGEDLQAWPSPTKLVACDVFSGERRAIDDVDCVVVADGSEPRNGLAAALAPDLELHVVGDACQPRTVEEATYQGARVGRRL